MLSGRRVGRHGDGNAFSVHSIGATAVRANTLSRVAIWAFALCSTLALAAQTPSPAPAIVAKPADPRLAQYKQQVAADIDGKYVFTQQMIDSVFSFGELG